MSVVVAINGDCETSETAPWVAGPIIYTDASKISVGGTKVILEAKCIFVNPGPPPVPMTLTLTPGTTKLKDNGSSVLRKGDSVSGGCGTLKVKDNITNKLKSA